MNRGRGNVFDCDVDFPQILNLGKFTQNKTNYNYKLKGVITHLGTSDLGGHFIAYCRHRIDDKWYCYNDAIVTLCQDQENGFKKGTPYILFYESINGNNNFVFDENKISNQNNLNGNNNSNKAMINKNTNNALGMNFMNMNNKTFNNNANMINEFSMNSMNNMFNMNSMNNMNNMFNMNSMNNMNNMFNINSMNNMNNMNNMNSMNSMNSMNNMFNMNSMNNMNMNSVNNMNMNGLGLFYYDWSYLIFMLPCLILSLICNASVKSNFSKYSQIQNSRRLTGAQAAQQVLSAHGVTGVRIEPVSGNLTDHFDPRSNVIRLSESVYNATTVAAVGVACHEAGHAVQHAEGYVPNKIRSAIVPVANIGSKAGLPLVIVGLIIGFFRPLITIGIFLFFFAVMFQVVTLPVEFNASSRGLVLLQDCGILSEEELAMSKKVLRAAALTYVAAAASSVMQLLRLVLLSNNRRRD